MRISELLYRILPQRHFDSVRRIYRRVQKQVYPPMTLQEMKRILDDMGIQKGDVVFIHASYEKLNAGFSVTDLLNLLLEQVGESGTLLFPSWAYSGKTEEYLAQKKPFNLKRSFTAMGMLAETARRRTDAIRSLHPTSSVAAIGPLAKLLTASHHLETYPFGKLSPHFKISEHKGKILGLGEKTMSLSFVHCLEDTVPELFPVSLHHAELVEASVIDKYGETHNVKTFVRRADAPGPEITPFIRKFISPEICRDFRYKGRNFFIADAAPLYSEMVALAQKNKTVYSF